MLLLLLLVRVVMSDFDVVDFCCLLVLMIFQSILLLLLLRTTVLLLLMILLLLICVIFLLTVVVAYESSVNVICSSPSIISPFLHVQRATTISHNFLSSSLFALHIIICPRDIPPILLFPLISRYPIFVFSIHYYFPKHGHVRSRCRVCHHSGKCVDDLQGSHPYPNELSPITH